MNIRILAVLSIVFAVGAGFLSCIITNDRVTQDQLLSSNTAAESAKPCSMRLDDGAENFAFSIYRLARERYNLSNFVISPYNIYEALLMLYEASNGTTRAQIGKALGIDPVCSVWDAYSKLRGSVINSSGRATLDLSSGIWIKNAFYEYMREDYINNLRRYFYSAVKGFSTPNELVDDVNHYVENKTRGLIRKPMELEYVNEQTVAVILTTLYFNASWEKPFRPKNITFTSIDGYEKLVKGMERSGEFYIYEDKEVIAALLPYNGSSFGLLVIMPQNINEFADYAKNLNMSVVRGIVSGMQEVKTNLVIPEFEVESKIENAKEILMRLGINEVFDPGLADLTKMAHVGKGDLYVDRVIHAAKIDVSETGTEAGAATIIIIDKTSIDTERTVIIDKPFIFMIIDTNNLIPLFMGQITTL